jgi:alanine racemase
MMNEANSWLELSRANLLHNLAGVRALVGGARIIAVVKANAYGAGAVGMAQTLAANGVDAFGVASVAEGVELRTHGIGGMILCLTYFTKDEVDAIGEYDLRPTVFTSDAAHLLAEHARKLNRRINVWIKVDTGLSRLGVSYHAAANFIREIAQYSWLKIEGVFSTLAENPERDPLQVERLRLVREQVRDLRAVPFSTASSNAILSLPQSYFDAVRPGIILHGIEPSERERMDMNLVRRADLRPITMWKARVGYVKVVPAGEQVGYGVQPLLSRDTPIATLAVGWADGYPPRMSDGGFVLLRERRCPVLAVSANSTLVDATRAPDVVIGEEAVLLGKQGSEEVTAAEVARATGSVYRLLTSIPREVARRWL